jgi:hypothetical protein
MLLDHEPPKPLLNLKKYAERMGITRQAVHYQLSKGQCLVPPIVGSKPPKWRVVDVDGALAPLRDR